ncbi:MAG: hypothetical protein ACE5KG_05245 [Nitrososphaerales archaeon]
MVLTKIALATLVIGLVIGGGLGYIIGVGYANEPVMESMDAEKKSMTSEMEGSMESKMESEAGSMESGEDMSMEEKMEPSMEGEKDAMMGDKEG